jgi:hypothetical protein
MFTRESNMKHVMVDPPSGWAYGFPKLWDGEEPLDMFLYKHGYPQSEIAFALNYMRMWPVEDDRETVV